MDVFDAAESFLPQFKLDGDIELVESSVEMSLQSVRVIEIDGMHLRGVLGGILDVVSQKLA